MAAGRTTIYECENCGFRHESDVHPGTCPECGRTMQNTAVPRE